MGKKEENVLYVSLKVVVDIAVTFIRFLTRGIFTLMDGRRKMGKGGVGGKRRSRLHIYTHGGGACPSFLFPFTYLVHSFWWGGGARTGG